MDEVYGKYVTMAHGNEYQILQEKAFDTFLTLCIIVAAGGFINMLKSVFHPKFQEEFLGMDLNTKSCIISVPNKKWEKSCDLIMYTKEKLTLLHLEVQ